MLANCDLHGRSGHEHPGPAKTIAFAALAMTLSLLACFASAEVILRFLPVATGLWSLPVNASQPILRYTPNRDFLFSRDWNFSIVNRGHVNNDGFVNNENYDQSDARPLLAVIGDSYVEAAMVPNDKTFYRLDASRLHGKGRIYSFGASGAPLSQYLVWAQYAAQKYRPDGIAIVVIGNDFDESLLTYNRRPGFHVYARGTDDQLQLTRLDFAPSPVRLLVRRSALARYLLLHLGVAQVADRVLGRFGLGEAAYAATPAYVGNTAAEASIERMRDSKEAVDAFFADLAKMIPLPPARIAFLVDGARYEHDIAITERSYFGRMRKYFMDEAGRLGYEVIDLEPWFVNRSRDGNVHFEFPTDGHWNADGHEVAAQALAHSGLYAGLFGRPD